MTDFHSISRSFQKKMARTKEKVLITFGKADRTTDEDFEVLSKSFNYQQVTANKLLRHYKNYTQQVKAMSSASKSMHLAMCEAYESSWDGSDKFHTATEQLNTLWDDHYVQVSDFLNFQIASYACKFPELKAKIEKRGRKLLDYDRTRHKVDNLERSKKRDEAKLNETIRELDAAQTIYEGINNELFEELPVLFDNRMPLLAKFFNSFLKVESTFEDESSKIKKKLIEINSVLPKDPSKLSRKSKVNTLRAKTLPRREPSKTYTSARYSPQMGRTNTGKHGQGDDRRKTMPARPLSPPFPSRFLNQHHPPAPTEPAPVPPSSTTSTSSSSSTSQTSSSNSKTDVTKSSGEPGVFMKPGDIRSLTTSAESTTGSSTASSHPTKPPQPKLPYTPHKPNPPKFGHLINHHNNSIDCITPTSALPARWGDEKYANTRDIINYIPHLTTSASTTTVVCPPISASPPLYSEASLTSDTKTDIPGFRDITMAPIEVDEPTQDATEVQNGKQIIENIYCNVESSVTDATSKAGEVVTDCGDVIAKSCEAAVESGEKSFTSAIAAASGDGTHEACLNGEVAVECASPGTVTSCSTIQVSDVVDAAKKSVEDVLTSTATTLPSATEVTSTTTSVKTINSPSCDNDIVVTNETISSILLPTSSYLFKVQATNNYKAADTDELNLEAGDVVYVLPIENIDLEDEGWALGLKQKDGTKGMFPVNFTRKIV